MPRLSLGNFPSSENTTGTAEHYNRTAKPGNSVATDPTMPVWSGSPGVPLDPKTPPSVSLEDGWFRPVSRGFVCGADRTRTDDPLLAKQVL